MATERIVRDLIKLREIIEWGWCQEEYALSDKGTPVSAGSKKACSWCITGGMMKVTRTSLYGPRAHDLAHYLQKAANNLDLIGWNDEKRRKKQQVVNMISRAIKLAEKDLHTAQV